MPGMPGVWARLSSSTRDTWLLGLPVWSPTRSLFPTTLCMLDSTTLRDELESKAAVGDAWAIGQLQKRSFPREEAQERRTLMAAKLVLTLSPYTADCVRTLAPQATVRSLPMPIDTDHFSPSDLDSS